MWESNAKTNELTEKNYGKPMYHAPAKKPKENLLTIQCIICAVIIIVIYGLKMMNSLIYSQFANEFSECIESGIHFSEETPILRFIDNTVDTARKAAVDLSNSFSNEESNNTQTASIGGFSNVNFNDIQNEVSLDAFTISEELIQPTYGVLTSKFGMRENPITLKEEFHLGIDIAAQQGAKIMASYSGQVIETGYTSQRGNYIILHHRQGLQTLYQHLECGFVHTGQNVNTGQIIGTVGNTGLSTGPHLHFELILNRKRVDALFLFDELAKTYNVDENQ